MTQAKYAISKIRTAMRFFLKKNYYAARTDITMAKLTLREIEKDLTCIISAIEIGKSKKERRKNVSHST